jgi:hypothetical protein
MPDAGILRSILTRGAERRSVELWARAADRALDCDLPALRGLAARGRRARAGIDRLLAIAAERTHALDAPLPEVPAPLNADWRWRPDPWVHALAAPGQARLASPAALAPGLTLFHDCPRSEIAFRQTPVPGASTPFALRFEVFGFDGSFLSLVADLPEAAMRGLGRSHILGLALTATAERPVEAFARLNVTHGPNTEQIVRDLPLRPEGAEVGFDLAYSGINAARVERAWIDLIFDSPRMNALTILDLTFHRRLRAAL